MWYCFEKFILGKPINDNLFLLIKVDRRNIPQDNKNLTFLIFEIIWKWPLIIADIWINHYSVFTFAIQSLWYNFMPVLSFKFLFHFWVFLKCIDVYVSVFLLPQNLQCLGKYVMSYNTNVFSVLLDDDKAPVFYKYDYL